MSVKSFLLCAVTALAALSSVDAAMGDSLTDRLNAKKPKAEEMKVDVACGKADKENCAIVVPAINEKTVSQGIRLTPLESKGSVESMIGLCGEDLGVNLAVVQADVFYKLSNAPDCSGKLSVLGSGLYPYQAFAIARADEKASSFEELVNNLKPGAAISVAAGGSGSGGEATLRNILAANPAWKQSVDIQADGADTALSKLKDGQLNVFFVMDGPKSPLLSDVRDSIDPKTKKPVFKFIDMRPNDKLLSLRFSNNQQLYATAIVEPGFWSSTKTISTPAVTVIRNDFYSANADAAKKIRQAAEDALPIIAAKAGAAPDWMKDFAPR